MDKNIAECAEQVRRGDPERFLSAMTAPPQMRGGLMVIYALNLEIARIPWLTQEPLIAEMRLQWWRDMVAEIYDGKPVSAHEVVTPLADLVQRYELPRDLLDGMIDARSWDIYRESHADMTAFDRYIADTAGAVMTLACLVLGRSAGQVAVADYGYAHGVSLLLRAVPALEQMGRKPLVNGTQSGVSGLAKHALDRWHGARHDLKSAPKNLRPALRSGWNTGYVLKQAIKNPGLVVQGGLEPSQAFNRLGLIWKNQIGSF